MQTTHPIGPAKQASALSLSVKSWFAIAATGQLAFIYFILHYYGTRTAVGDYAAWDDKPLIEGYVAGDVVGNLMFITHVLLAAVITLAGLHQLIPTFRKRWPISHRVVGRVFILVACFMALNGLWLVWGRGTFLSLVSAVATSINAVLILVFVVAAGFFAMQRRISDHRRWALRAFLAVNGVWFFRIGIMSWVIVNGGPVGMNETLSGPADIAISFGSYLIPLALLEVYFLAQAGMAGLRHISPGSLVVGSLITGLGVFGTIAFMWGPYL
ncbi:MAG: DUF2306 domain-containing protein [Pseudomonadota bacterium]